MNKRTNTISNKLKDLYIEIGSTIFETIQRTGLLLINLVFSIWEFLQKCSEQTTAAIVSTKNIFHDKFYDFALKALNNFEKAVDYVYASRTWNVLKECATNTWSTFITKAPNKVIGLIKKSSKPKTNKLVSIQEEIKPIEPLEADLLKSALNASCSRISQLVSTPELHELVRKRVNICPGLSSLDIRLIEEGLIPNLELELTKLELHAIPNANRLEHSSLKNDLNLVRYLSGFVIKQASQLLSFCKTSIAGKINYRLESSPVGDVINNLNLLANEITDDKDIDPENKKKILHDIKFVLLNLKSILADTARRYKQHAFEIITGKHIEEIKSFPECLQYFKILKEKAKSADESTSTMLSYALQALQEKEKTLEPYKNQAHKILGKYVLPISTEVLNTIYIISLTCYLILFVSIAIIFPAGAPIAFTLLLNMLYWISFVSGWLYYLPMIINEAGKAFECIWNWINYDRPMSTGETIRLILFILGICGLGIGIFLAPIILPIIFFVPNVFNFIVMVVNSIVNFFNSLRWFNVVNKVVGYILNAKDILLTIKSYWGYFTYALNLSEKALPTELTHIEELGDKNTLPTNLNNFGDPKLYEKYPNLKTLSHSERYWLYLLSSNSEIDQKSLIISIKALYVTALENAANDKLCEIKNLSSKETNKHEIAANEVLIELRKLIENFKKCFKKDKHHWEHFSITSNELIKVKLDLKKPNGERDSQKSITENKSAKYEIELADYQIDKTKLPNPTFFGKKPNYVAESVNLETKNEMKL